MYRVYNTYSSIRNPRPWWLQRQRRFQADHDTHVRIGWHAGGGGNLVCSFPSCRLGWSHTRLCLVTCTPRCFEKRADAFSPRPTSTVCRPAPCLIIDESKHGPVSAAGRSLVERPPRLDPRRSPKIPENMSPEIPERIYVFSTVPGRTDPKTAPIAGHFFGSWFHRNVRPYFAKNTAN